MKFTDADRERLRKEGERFRERGLQAQRDDAAVVSASFGSWERLIREEEARLDSEETEAKDEEPRA
ncbi:hypothetical protein ACFLZY_02410 [Patescibacteria group bacterium]